MKVWLPSWLARASNYLRITLFGGGPPDAERALSQLGTLDNLPEIEKLSLLRSNERSEKVIQSSSVQETSSQIGHRPRKGVALESSPLRLD
jgi:hypothetical protein